MKKLSLILAYFALLSQLTAQTILLSENFNASTPPSLPNSWQQINGDGLTVSSSLASYSFGTNAWVTRSATLDDPAWASYGKFAASTSDYISMPTNTDDWLISPSFMATTGSYLNWEAIGYAWPNQQSYEVLVSTSGTSTAAFTHTVFSTTSENNTWTMHSLSLNTFSGQTIHVAFRNQDNFGDRLFIDNINVIVPLANDGSVTSIIGVPRYTAPGNITLSGSFLNNGSAVVNNVSFGFRVDNGPITLETKTLPGGGLNYQQSSGYFLSTPANVTPGYHKIKVWVNATNGVPETNKLNDTVEVDCHVATQARPRNILIEEFTSSTCNPCAQTNSSLDPLLNTYNPNSGGSVNVIKYQMNWPSPGNDPSYNAHGLKRRIFYGVPGIPFATSNGAQNSNIIYTNNTVAEINSGLAEPAWADITPSISVTGNIISASASILPYITVSGPIRVFQALCQKSYNYSGSTTTPPQTVYFHTMRVMNPNGSGQPVNLTAGTPFTVSFNHTATVASPSGQNTFNFWTNSPSVNYEYVVFLQDTISKEIFNSGSAPLLTTGLVNLDKNTKIGVSPNPASSIATIAIHLDASEKVSLVITDVTGKIVYTKQEEWLSSGQNEITLNTESFSPGSYSVRVKLGSSISNTKLIITK